MLTNHPDIDWILYYRHTLSTMREADNLMQSVKSLPEKILLVADVQTGGYGRNNSQWLSPQGGLWFTCLIKSDNNHSQISLLVGLSLYQSLLKHFPGLNDHLKIKWPNDILLSGKKLAGILIKSTGQYLCIGVGLNTNIGSFPTGMKLEPTSLMAEFGFTISNDALLSTIISDFNRMFEVYQHKGFLHFVPAINSCLQGINQNIAFDKGMETVYGICLGVNGEGALLLKTEKGHITQNYSGSIVRFNV